MDKQRVLILSGLICATLSSQTYAGSVDPAIDDEEAVTITIERDGMQYPRNALRQSTRNSQLANRLRRGNPFPCPKVRTLECYKLVRKVAKDSDGSADLDYIFAKPMPSIIAEISDIGFGTDASSATIRTNWASAFQDTILTGYKGTDPMWFAFVPVEEVSFGQSAVTLLNKLAEESDTLPCDAVTCRRYFRLNSGLSNEMIAMCYVEGANGITSFPHSCSIELQKMPDGRWYIESIVSPGDLLSGFGAGAEGLFCNFPVSMTTDKIVEGIKSAFSATPVDLPISVGRTLPNGSINITGQRKGRQSLILQTLGEGTYYENIIYIGNLIKDEDRFIFNGTLSINVNRNKSGIQKVAYELSDDKSYRYAEAFSRALEKEIESRLGSDAECDAE